jgi:tetratricopeptide (TPR) repeat protein
MFSVIRLEAWGGGRGVRAVMLSFLVVTLWSLRASSMVPGDDAFAIRDYESAAARYATYLSQGGDSAEVYWRLSRLTVCMGDVAPADQRETYYQKAADYATQAIRTNPRLAYGYSWHAASLGSLAMYVGGKTKVRLSREIKEDLDRAIALDPRDDIAYSILGSFYLALEDVSWIERQLANAFLGGLPDGGIEDAEKALRKAVEIAPTVIRHQYELGLVYRAQGRDQEAMRAFEKVLTLPVVLASDPRTQSYAKERIEEMS